MISTLSVASVKICQSAQQLCWAVSVGLPQTSFGVVFFLAQGGPSGILKPSTRNVATAVGRSDMSLGVKKVVIWEQLKS